MDEGLKQKIETQASVGEIDSFEEIEEGLNSIYRIEASKGEFVVKERTNERNDVEWFRAEPLIYRLLDDLDIPSPEIVFSRPHPENGDPFFVMEKLEGVNPEGFKEEISFEALKSITAEFGRILGIVHSNTAFGGYGMLGGFEGEVENVYGAESWTESIRSSLEKLEQLIGDGLEDPPELDFPENQEIMKKLPERPESVLLHMDNRLDNLLVDGDEVKAFLDWSHPESGHHEYDIVRAEYLLIDYDLDFLSDEKKDILRELLYQSYEDEKKIDRKGFDERRELYRKLTVIWIIAGFPNWGSELDEGKRNEYRRDLINRARTEGL